METIEKGILLGIGFAIVAGAIWLAYAFTSWLLLGLLLGFLGLFMWWVACDMFAAIAKGLPHLFARLDDLTRTLSKHLPYETYGDYQRKQKPDTWREIYDTWRKQDDSWKAR